jgi:hypothetical protein
MNDDIHHYINYLLEVSLPKAMHVTTLMDIAFIQVYLNLIIMWMTLKIATSLLGQLM